MPRKTTTPKFEYRIVQAELWGNARDGFDTNNWFTLERWKTTEAVSERYLLRMVRNQFEGRLFNWSEDKHTFMSRDGIELEDSGAESMLNVTYRGYKIGEVQWDELCSECGDSMRALVHSCRENLIKAVSILE